MRRRKKRGCLYALTTVVGVFCMLLFIIYVTGEKLNIQKEAKKTVSIPYQEIDAELEESLGEKYYYQQIGAEEQAIYQEILQGIKENVDEIYTHGSDADRTIQLFQYVLKDYPDIFWCDGTATATAYEEEESYTILRPDYIYNNEEKTVMKEEIEDTVLDCLSGISAEESEYQKILYVYEYIVNTVEYDQEASDNQNIYSVFAHHRSVCAGYSKATQYLLEKLGVFCTYVTGTTTGGQSHAWNLVRCNGEYYYVDTTWGDPVFQAAEGEEVNQLQNISYDYMCCDDTELLKNHTPDNDVELPSCTRMDCNYYVMNGMYYDSYDGEIILQKMNDIISSKGNPVVLKFKDSGVYGQAHDDIFQNIIHKAAQNLASWYGLTEVKYQYMDEPELNKITIYWQYE